MRTKLLSLLMVGMLLVAAAPVVEAGLFADFLALFTPRAPTPTDTTPSEPTGAQGQVGSPGDTGPTGQTGPSAIVITPNDEAQVRRAGLSPANQDLLVAAVTKRNLARAAQERTPRSTHRQTALRESEAELKQATIDTGFQPLAFGGGIETSILETGGAIRGSLDDGKQFEGHVSTSDPNDPGVRGAAGDIGQFGATGSVGSEEFSSGSRVKVALSQEDTSRVQESIRQLDRDRSNFRAKFNEFDDRALGLEKEAERLQHDRDGRNFLSRLGGPSQEEIDALTERAKVERKLAGIAKRNFDETIAKLTPLLEAQIREARNQAVQAALRPDGEPSRPEVTSLAGDQTSPVSIEDQIGSREVLRQQTVRDAEDSLSDEARQALDVFRDAARVTREATEKGAVTDAEFDVIVEIERTFRERAESLLDAELANPNDPLNQLTSDILANAVEQGTLIAEENIAFTTPSRDARIGINKQTPDPSQGTSIDQPSINARSSNTDVARSEHLQEKLAKVDANIATLKDRANDVNAKTSAQTQLQDVDNTGFFDRQIPFATAKHIQVNRRVAVDANGFEFFEVEIQGEKAILRVPTDPKGRLSVAKVDGSSISQLLQKNAFQNLEEEGGFFETNNNLVRSDLSEKRFGALGAKIQNARTEDRQNRQEAESLLVQIDAANKERQALAAQAPANFRDTTAIANLEAADRKKDRQKLILLRSIQTDGSLSETQRAQILGKIQAGDLAGAQDAISKSQSRDKALLQDRLGQLSQATVEQEKQQSLSIRNAQTLSRLQDRATVSRQSLNENVLVRGNGLNTVQQKLIADALLRNDFDAARRVLDKIGLNSEEGRAQSIIVQKINTLETIQQNIDKEKQAGGTPTLSAKLALEQQQNLNALSQQLADASEGAAGLALKFAVSGARSDAAFEAETTGGRESGQVTDAERREAAEAEVRKANRQVLIALNTENDLSGENSREVRSKLQNLDDLSIADIDRLLNDVVPTTDVEIVPSTSGPAATTREVSANSQLRSKLLQLRKAKQAELALRPAPSPPAPRANIRNADFKVGFLTTDVEFSRDQIGKFSDVQLVATDPNKGVSFFQVNIDGKPAVIRVSNDNLDAPIVIAQNSEASSIVDIQRLIQGDKFRNVEVNGVQRGVAFFDDTLKTRDLSLITPEFDKKLRASEIEDLVNEEEQRSQQAREALSTIQAEGGNVKPGIDDISVFSALEVRDIELNLLRNDDIASSIEATLEKSDDAATVAAIVANRAEDEAQAQGLVLRDLQDELARLPPSAATRRQLLEFQIGEAADEIKRQQEIQKVASRRSEEIVAAREGRTIPTAADDARLEIGGALFDLEILRKRREGLESSGSDADIRVAREEELKAQEKVLELKETVDAAQSTLAANIQEFFDQEQGQQDIQRARGATRRQGIFVSRALEEKTFGLSDQDKARITAALSDTDSLSIAQIDALIKEVDKTNTAFVGSGPGVTGRALTIHLNEELVETFQSLKKAKEKELALRPAPSPPAPPVIDVSKATAALQKATENFNKVEANNQREIRSAQDQIHELQRQIEDRADDTCFLSSCKKKRAEDVARLEGIRDGRRKSILRLEQELGQAREDQIKREEELLKLELTAEAQKALAQASDTTSRSQVHQRQQLAILAVDNVRTSSLGQITQNGRKVQLTPAALRRELQRSDITADELRTLLQAIPSTRVVTSGATGGPAVSTQEVAANEEIRARIKALIAVKADDQFDADDLGEGPAGKSVTDGEDLTEKEKKDLELKVQEEAKAKKEKAKKEEDEKKKLEEEKRKTKARYDKLDAEIDRLTEAMSNAKTPEEIRKVLVLIEALKRAGTLDEFPALKAFAETLEDAAREQEQLIQEEAVAAAIAAALAKAALTVAPTATTVASTTGTTGTGVTSGKPSLNDLAAIIGQKQDVLRGLGSGKDPKARVASAMKTNTNAQKQASDSEIALQQSQQANDETRRTTRESLRQVNDVLQKLRDKGLDAPADIDLSVVDTQDPEFIKVLLDNAKADAQSVLTAEQERIVEEIGPRPAPGSGAFPLSNELSELTALSVELTDASEESAKSAAELSKADAATLKAAKERDDKAKKAQGTSEALDKANEAAAEFAASKSKRVDADKALVKAREDFAKRATAIEDDIRTTVARSAADVTDAQSTLALAKKNFAEQRNTLTSKDPKFLELQAAVEAAEENLKVAQKKQETDVGDALVRNKLPANALSADEIKAIVKGDPLFANVGRNVCQLSGGKCSLRNNIGSVDITGALPGKEERKKSREVSVSAAKINANGRQLDTLNAKEFDAVRNALGDIKEAPRVAQALLKLGVPLHRGLTDDDGVLKAGKTNEFTIVKVGSTTRVTKISDPKNQRTEVVSDDGTIVGRFRTKDGKATGFILEGDEVKKVEGVNADGSPKTAATGIKTVIVANPGLPTNQRAVPLLGGIAEVSDKKGNRVLLNEDGEIIGGKLNKEGIFEADKNEADALEAAEKQLLAARQADGDQAKLFDDFNAEAVRGERGISDVFSAVRERTGGSGFLAGRALKKYEEFKGLGQLGSFFIGDEKIQERRDRLIDSFCLFGGVSTCFRSALCDEKLPSDSIAGKDILFSVSPTGEVKSVAWISASKGQAFIDIGDDGLGTALALYKVEYGVRNSINDRLGYNIVFFPSTRVADRTPRNWYIKNRELEPGQNEQFSGTTSLLKNSNTDYDRVCIAFSTGIRNRKGDKVSKQCTKITSFEGPPQKFKNPNETKDSPAQGPLGAGGGLIPTFSGGGSSTSSSGQPALNDGGAI